MEPDVPFPSLENTRNGRWKLKDKWVWLTLSHSSNSLFPSSFTDCNKYREMVSAKVICFLWLTFFPHILKVFSIFCIIEGKLIKGWNLSTPPENLHWLFIHSLILHHNRNFIHCIAALFILMSKLYILYGTRLFIHCV